MRRGRFPARRLYSPVAGTMLSAGANQALQVTFTPADTTDYTTATGTVYITVNQESTTTTVTSLLVNPSVVGQSAHVHGHGQRDGVRCRHADRHGHFPGRRHTSLGNGRSRRRRGYLHDVHVDCFGRTASPRLMAGIRTSAAAAARWFPKLNGMSSRTSAPPTVTRTGCGAMGGWTIRSRPSHPM